MNRITLTYLLTAFFLFAVSISQTVSSQTNRSAETDNVGKQFEIGNRRYLFDVNKHDVEELRALLSRIEVITETSPEAFQDLEIVLVLHGPDINLFRHKHAKENRQLVELAAKLDSLNVVDIKACETSMDYQGIDARELPPFIETVPYAPDTIQTLKEQGYINL